MHSYPSIYNLGHKEVLDIFKYSVFVQEKIDGSQFSFGLYDGELVCRSKGAEINIDAPEGMFKVGVEYIKSIQDRLTPYYTYRGEYLQKSKHNVLAYNRFPDEHIIGFDVMTEVEEGYLNPIICKNIFNNLGLEFVPTLYEGIIHNIEELKGLLDTTSILGGTKIEGMVIKAYGVYGRDKKTLMAKYVSEKFKEIAGGEWRKANPTKGDIIDELILRYKTPARWEKAIQHLKENEILTNSPKDIGGLILEVQNDIQKECEEEIKDILFKEFLPKIRRGCIFGLPEYYKDKLAKSMFEKGD